MNPLLLLLWGDGDCPGLRTNSLPVLNSTDLAALVGQELLVLVMCSMALLP